MSISTKEAATILGVSQEKVRDWQERSILPDPIPDDYFDSVIEFRIRLEEAFRRRQDRLHGAADEEG